MTTSGNVSATMLLITGLLGVGMATMGYYYLQMSSKKSCMLTMEREKSASVKLTAIDEQTNEARCSSANASKTTIKTMEKTAAVATTKFTTNNLKTASESPQKIVKQVVESLANPPIDAEQASNEVKSDPKSASKSSRTTSIESPKEEVGTLSVGLPESAHASLTKDLENPESVVGSSKETLKEAEAVTVTISKQALACPIETLHSLEKVIASSDKATKAEPATKELESVTRNVSKDFVVAQAVIEIANAFTDELLQESLENAALEQEEYVQVELTQSMTLSQSTTESVNIKDTAVKTEEVVKNSDAIENEENDVREEQDSFEAIESASAEPVVDAAATISTIASSNTGVAPGPLGEDTSEMKAAASADGSTEPTLINVPAENTEMPFEDKHNGCLASSGGSTSNRSKKSKSKKKKDKKQRKLNA